MWSILAERLFGPSGQRHQTQNLRYHGFKSHNNHFFAFFKKIFKMWFDLTFLMTCQIQDILNYFTDSNRKMCNYQNGWKGRYFSLFKWKFYFKFQWILFYQQKIEWNHWSKEIKINNQSNNLVIAYINCLLTIKIKLIVS